MAAMIENLSRVQYVYLAKLAEQSERYEEMAEFMQSLVLTVAPSSELSSEERGLLSASLKHVIGSLRAAWRIVSSIERRRGPEDAAMAAAYRSRVEAGLSEACESVLRLIDSHLLPSAATTESHVFFLKMKGDYHRYLAEFQVDDDRRSSAAETLKAYSIAQDLAEKELPPTHPIRLGLALNFSVFYYEILDQHDQACALAKKAFEKAVGESDSGVQVNKDSDLVIQLLRDNLSAWS